MTGVCGEGDSGFRGLRGSLLSYWRSADCAGEFVAGGAGENRRISRRSVDCAGEFVGGGAGKYMAIIQRRSGKRSGKRRREHII